MSNDDVWALALVIGLVAALIVAALLFVLVRAVRDIEHSVGGLLEIAGKVGANTAHIPQLEATAPVLAAVVVAVLAVALIEVRRGLHRISEGLATLGSALETVEAEHLRPLEPAVKAINAQFDTILSALPGIGAKAAVVAERRPR